MLRGRDVARGPQVTTITPGVNRSAIVFWLGAPLIAVNFVGNSPAVLASVAGPVPGSVPKWLRPQGESIADIVLQGFILGALVLLAKYSDAGGSLAIAFLVALWLLFLINKAPQVAALASTGSAPKTPAQKGK